jgi:hypothetical protein
MVARELRADGEMAFLATTKGTEADSNTATIIRLEVARSLRREMLGHSATSITSMAPVPG